MRRGLTLIEMLAVIVIMVLLLAVAIPIVRMSSVGRAQNDGAEKLRALLQKAQAEAASTQRETGVLFRRAANNSGECFEISLCQSPLPYSGDVDGAGCFVDGLGGVGTIGTALVGPATVGAPQFPVTSTEPPTGMLLHIVCKPGDRVRFNHKGPLFRIVSVAQGTFTFTHQYSPSPPKNPPIFDNTGNPRDIQKYTYTIYRQPDAISTSLITLPEKTTVDLRVSGSGQTGQEFAGGSGPIAVVFSPRGSLDRIYFNGTSQQALSPVAFLIGTSERLNDVGPGEVGGTLADGEAYWVGATPQGRVFTVENQTWEGTLGPGDPISAKISLARQYIRNP